MAVNLLNYLKEQFTPSVINQLSTHLNESPQNTQNAVAGVLPAILGGLTQRVQETGGASSILGLLRDGNYGNTPLDISQVIGSRGDEQAAAATGSNLLDRIFGDNTDTVADAVAQHSGVKQSSALSIMGLAGSVLMSILGLQTQENGLTATNLTTLLAGQADYIRQAMPSGLGALSNQLGLSSEAKNTGNDEAQRITSYMNTPVNPDIPKSPDVERRQENVRWLRWGMFAAAALILFLIIQKCRQDQTGTGGIMTDTTSRVESDAGEGTSGATRQNVEDANASTQDTAAGPFDRTDPEPAGVPNNR